MERYKKKKTNISMKLEKTELDSHKYGQFIFDKDARIFNGKEQSQQGSLKQLDIHTAKNEVGSLPVAHAKIN